MLKAAIEERGLDSLVAPDGETAAAQLKSQLESEGATPTNYETRSWAPCSRSPTTPPTS